MGHIPCISFLAATVPFQILAFHRIFKISGELVVLKGGEFEYEVHSRKSNRWYQTASDILFFVQYYKVLRCLGKFASLSSTKWFQSSGRLWNELKRGIWGSVYDVWIGLEEDTVGIVLRVDRRALYLVTTSWSMSHIALPPTYTSSEQLKMKRVQDTVKPPFKWETLSFRLKKKLNGQILEMWFLDRQPVRVTHSVWHIVWWRWNRLFLVGGLS